VVFIKRKPIIMSISLCFIIAIGLIAAILIRNSETATKVLPVNQVKDSKINHAAVGNYISKNHEYWNEQLCWGRSKNYSFSVFQKNYNQYVKNLIIIIDAVDEQDLKSDLKQVNGLLKNASETKNIDYLIDVHRIFHDLDLHFNGYSTSDDFGITAYGEKN
jgi:hypothetical protein